jgi:hypothetical protein
MVWHRALLSLSSRYGTLTTVKRRLFQRWPLILGVLAMLGAGIIAPMTAAHAAAKPGITSSMSTGVDAMPCHKPANPCPDCPQKSCPDMGAGCVVKCSQLVAQPAAMALSYVPVVSPRVPSAAPQAVSGSLTPPLLRPPIV